MIHNQMWRVGVLLTVAVPFEWVSRCLNSKCGLFHQLINAYKKQMKCW